MSVMSARNTLPDHLQVIRKEICSGLTPSEKAEVLKIQEESAIFVLNSIRDKFLKEMMHPSKDPRDITVKINMRDRIGNVFQGNIRKEVLLRQEKDALLQQEKELNKLDTMNKCIKGMASLLAFKVCKLLLVEADQMGKDPQRGAVIYALDRCEDIYKKNIPPMKSIFVTNVSTFVATSLFKDTQIAVLLLKSAKDPTLWELNVN